MKITITPAMQDYLEGILIVQNKRKVVRVKDLAGLLKVKASSVIEALMNLNKKELVIHERYGYIELTQKGYNMAKKLYDRHCTLKKFLSKIIGVKESIAESDACKIEHYLSKQTMKRIVDFMNFVEAAPPGCSSWLNKYHSFVGNDDVADMSPGGEERDDEDNGSNMIKLSELKIGSKARVLKVIDSGILKRRLLDMGFVKNEIVQVKKVAPLGSPIDVLVKKTHISLRKDEADKILIEME